jgi:hypothetical protein
MTSPFSSPTSTKRNGRWRRGFSLIEIVTVGTLLVLVIGGVSAILSASSRIMVRTMLQTSADANAVKAIDHMILDVREAKQVTIVAANHIRIYYPVSVTANQYDRTRLDSTHYVDYAQTDATGAVSATGAYLWRSTDSNAGWAVATNLSQFTVTSFASSAVELTVKVLKPSGQYSAATTLNQKVIYLRNY